MKPFPSRRVLNAIITLLAVASLFVFISVFWQHIGSSAGVVMGESLSYGSVQGHVGVVAVVISFFLLPNYPPTHENSQELLALQTFLHVII